MIQKNFDLALKKGDYAECLIKSLLEGKRYIVYQPETGGAHAFDMLAIRDKANMIALDVKAKAKRKYFDDTGIDERHYTCYQRFSDKHNLTFWLIFVDESMGQIYGNSIEKLDKPFYDKIKNIQYPLLKQSAGGNVIRYWHMSSMHNIGTLPDKDCDELKKLSQRNYDY